MTKDPFNYIHEEFAIVLFVDEQARSLDDNSCDKVISEAAHKAGRISAGKVIPHFYEDRLFLVVAIQHDRQDDLDVGLIKNTLKKLINKCKELSIVHVAFPEIWSGSESWNILRSLIDIFAKTDIDYMICDDHYSERESLIHGRQNL